MAEGLLRRLLRKFILLTYKHSHVVTANSYLEDYFATQGVLSVGQTSLWAEECWSNGNSQETRSIDVVMVLRRGHVKRLDMYLDLLGRMKERGIICAVITPDGDLYHQITELANTRLLCPSVDEMVAIYRRSKVFLLLSDSEGFALPPLEAMGSGCVPLCRDSGGPRIYMQGPLAANLVPLQATVDEILHRFEILLTNKQQLSRLSIEARRIFTAGLAGSRVKREECMRKLMDIFTTNPQVFTKK